MSKLKPTITTARDVVSFVHALRSRLQDRNQDFRTLSHSKALHTVAEAKDYPSWQHYSAELLKNECFEVLTQTYDLHPANAKAAIETLTTDAIRYANTGQELAEELTRTYASVPMPSQKPSSKEAQLNHAMLEDCLDVHKRLKNGENVEDVGVYGASVSCVEVCLVMGSNSNMYLMVNSRWDVLSGRIESFGFANSEILHIESEHLELISELYDIEISDALAKINFGEK